MSGIQVPRPRYASLRRATQVLTTAMLVAGLPLTGKAGAGAQLSEQMRSAFPDARPVTPYSSEQVALTIQKILKLAAPPSLSTPIALTPDAPYSREGSHLSFWKPAFLLGTAAGGEAGINFWNIYHEGHVNVGFAAVSGQSVLMDCRLYSAGNIAYKIYSGEGGALSSQGELKISDGHVLLLVPNGAGTGLVSVELWPNPVQALMGFLGCNLWAFSRA